MKKTLPSLSIQIHVKVVDPIYVEPYIKNAKVGERYQFERLAYFAVDKDSTDEKLVFNRTVTLRDQWKKQQNKQSKKKQKQR